MTNSVSKIGPYTIETEIGRGGMAIVYRAKDTRNDRIVALKVLSSQANRNRFLREAETAKRLQHPNIVQIYESGEADGYYYIAMEYADGGTLTQRLRNVAGPIELTETLSILQPVAIALDYAHSQGLLHRDIKSSNILLSSNGRILLTDFGVAQEMDDDATQVTIAGYSVGTPAYMSPEQARGIETLDARSDIYSLGVVAYEMLIGRRPHQADSSLVLLRKIADDPPTAPEVANPQINPNIAYVLRCVLSKDRSLRYLTASEFVHALKQASAISSASSQRAVNTNHKLQPKRSPAYRYYIPLLIGLIVLAAFFYWLAKDWLHSYKTLITILKSDITSTTTPTLVTTEVGRSIATAMETATPIVTVPNQTQPTLLRLANTLTETNVATITATFTPAPVSTPTEWILQDQEIKRIGIQLSLPPEWSVEQHNSLHTFYNEDRTALFFVDRIYPTSPVTSTALLLTEYLAQGNAPIHSAQSIAERRIQYNNYSVVEQNYEFILLGGTPAMAKLRLFEDNGRFFVFGTLTVAAKAQEFANVFEQIFRTLILLPDPTPSSSATSTQTATKTVTSTQTATPTETTTPSSTRTPTITPTPTITATSTTAVTDTPTTTTRVIESSTQKITSVITPTPTDTKRVTATNTSVAMMPGATFTAPAIHTEPIITPTLIFTMAPTKTASATSTKTPPTTTPSVTPTPTSFTPTEDMVMTLVAIDTMLAALETQLPASVTTTETELPTLTMTPTMTPTQTLTPTRLPTRTSTSVLPKSASIQTADSELACSNGAERNWYNKMDVNLSVSPNVKLPRNISYELIAYEAGFSPLIVDNRHAYVIGQFDQKTSTKLDLTKLNPSPKYSLAIALFFKNAASDKKRLIIGWGDCTIKISQ